ncbi:MAG: hypothetical protein AB7P07_05650, partial [Hyphomonadaceae bacterium]
LRIVKEWSPYYALDPDADYSYSGAPGEGQRMRWVSDVRRVGEGTMSIVRSEENRFVETILEFRDRATLNTRIDLARAANGSRAVWSVSARCGEGYVNIPCRYMNLILRRMIEQDLDSGLSRLKTLAEQLPNVDFEGMRPDISDVPEQAYVYTPVTTSTRNPAEVEQALNVGVAQVDSFMTQHALTRAGPQLRVTTEWDQAQNRMSFRVGYPYSGATPLTVVGVQIGQTPSGRAMHVTHEAPRNQMPMTYARVYAYLQAHRIPMREDGLPWEVVHDEGAADGSRAPRIEIFVPLAERSE